MKNGHRTGSWNCITSDGEISHFIRAYCDHANIAENLFLFSLCTLALPLSSYNKDFYLSLFLGELRVGKVNTLLTFEKILKIWQIQWQKKLTGSASN